MSHVTELPLEGSIESSLRQAATLGIVADADFTTDLATTVAAIEARNVNLDVKLLPQKLAALSAVRQGFKSLGATVMITDLATIYAAVAGTWGPGFPVHV